MKNTSSNKNKPDSKTLQKLLDDDLQNILKRVESGKTLTESQLHRVEAHLAKSAKSKTPDAPAFVKNISQLADVLGESRQKIAYWKKQPGSPAPCKDGRLSVESWRKFLESFGVLQGEGSEATSAKAEQILLQNEKLKDHILRTREELIPMVMAKQMAAKLVLSAKARCFSSISKLVMLARMAPDTATATAEIQKEMCIVWASLAGGSWLTEKPASDKTLVAPVKG